MKKKVLVVIFVFLSALSFGEALNICLIPSGGVQFTSSESSPLLISQLGSQFRYGSFGFEFSFGLGLSLDTHFSSFQFMGYGITYYNGGFLYSFLHCDSLELAFKINGILYSLWGDSFSSDWETGVGCFLVPQWFSEKGNSLEMGIGANFFANGIINYQVYLGIGLIASSISIE